MSILIVLLLAVSKTWPNERKHEKSVTSTVRIRNIRPYSE